MARPKFPADKKAAILALAKTLTLRQIEARGFTQTTARRVLAEAGQRAQPAPRGKPKEKLMSPKPPNREAVVQMARQNVGVPRLVKVFRSTPEEIGAILDAAGMKLIDRDPWKNRRDSEGKAVPREPKQYDVLPEDRRYKPPPAKPNPMKLAETTFGSRLRDKGGAWHLDGRPIRFDDLCRKVNEQHVAWGMTQPLTANPSWLAKVVD